MRKAHVRADPRCRLHGVTSRQPKGNARDSVGVTTENYVKFRCRGIQPYNGGAWRALMDEFTERRFTWITRPLVQTTTEEGELVFYDTNLERPYTDAEGDQVNRELDEAITQRQTRYKARQLLHESRI